MPTEPFRPADEHGLYIMSLSVHGLVRGTDIELGRDADTGGQVLYVLDQARALARHPHVEMVEVLTRQIWDQKVDESYAQPREELEEGARIVRLPFGPKRYLHKESLWPYLTSMVDQTMRLIRARGRAPDLIHGHYADGGFVGAQVAKILGIPFFFTGHSLGRVKEARLLEQGLSQETMEARYRISGRIEAEEGALETATSVVASTRQEVKDQYDLYDHYQPDRKVVIPPGVDFSRHSPPLEAQEEMGIHRSVNRFFTDPTKPILMAMARADDRKNFATLVQAYGESPSLREKANLLLVMGNRDDIQEMPAGAKRVLTQILLLVDRYDLYGSVAYPKNHQPNEVPSLYRMAAASGGIFVNPALTEPFGLTLLEAAASGLPIVATNDGGPQDIIGTCKNGALIDPTDAGSMAQALDEALSDRNRWQAWSKNGVEKVLAHFSWESHAERYLGVAEKALGGLPEEGHYHNLNRRRRLPRLDRLLVTDVDDTLSGDTEALKILGEVLEASGDHVGFGIATGRPLAKALELMEELGIRTPDILITATGTEIHYGENLVKDRSWERQISYRWEPGKIRSTLSALPGLSLQEEGCTTPFRLRFRRDSEAGPTIAAIKKVLRQDGLRVTATLDHLVDLDVTPFRASPGLAIRFIAHKWHLPPERILVAGDSGNDADMLVGDTLGVVVGNHTPELEGIKGHPKVFFANGKHAWGILDGIHHFDFFDTIRIPEEETP
jgi:sucrose-phosphate synthase